MIPERFLKPVHPWKIWTAAVAIPLLAGGAFVLYQYYRDWQRFFPPCPVFKLLHWYCPGCGSTRAAYRILHGDIAGSFRYNPILLPTLIFAALLFFLPEQIQKPKIIRVYFLLLVIFCVLRNLPWHPFTLLAPPAGF